MNHRITVDNSVIFVENDKIFDCDPVVHIELKAGGEHTTDTVSWMYTCNTPTRVTGCIYPRIHVLCSRKKLSIYT